jgi:WD40-like Beta Propeller Repeat
MRARHFKIALSIVVAMLITSIAGLTQSQQQARPPGTDIFVVELSERGGRLGAGRPQNITRRPGYDNQPFFMPDGRSVLYTSIREDGQADIYRYDLEKGTTARVTETAEAEYSPTLMPDGKHISVIRVEADSTQRLWKFPLAGGKPSLVLEKTKPVGYHAWVDHKRVVVFILGTPNTLQLVDVATGKADVIASSVGRSIARIPGQPKVSFVHKLSADEWVIKDLDADSLKTGVITKTLSGSEDYAWTQRGDLLMAKGAKLFKLTPKKDGDWQEVADFSSEGVTAITRLAVSPKGNRVAFVANEKE